MADKIITAPQRAAGTKFTVDHFMALTESKPHMSMLTVHDKQDGFFYRLVRNDAHRIRYFQALGYTVVTDKDDATMVDSGQPDNRRVVGAGELVLMKQPENYHQMHKRALEKKAQERARGPIESFKSKAKTFGVETIDETREVRGPLEMGQDDD